MLGCIINDANDDHLKNYRKGKYKYYKKSYYGKNDYINSGEDSTENPAS